MLRRPLIFDMRGLWADERTDNGSWAANGLVDRAVRQTEAHLLRAASHTTVLTNVMLAHLRQSAYPPRHGVTVIPTCADLTLFAPHGPVLPELEPELRGRPVLVYLGGLGPRMLHEEMVEFYREWRSLQQLSCRFLVLSTSDVGPLREAMHRRGLMAEFVHRGLPREDVPKALRLATAGVCFYRPGTSTLGICPTKIGEIMACGLPVCSSPVGDSGEVLQDATGSVVDPDSPEDRARGARALVEAGRLPDGGRVRRAAAERWFSLEAGIRAYDMIYRRLVHKGPWSEDAPWPPESTSPALRSRGGAPIASASGHTPTRRGR